MKKKIKAPKTAKPKKKKKIFKRVYNTLTFLILIGFAGFVFYRGWIQLSIPENHYALGFSKTGGYESSLMKAGDFNWRWENLFPSNMTLHIFELPWESSELSLSGILPSGEEYATILPEKSAFNFKLKVSIKYRLNPENISQFIQEEDFQYTDIETWYDDFSRKSENVVMTALSELLKETEDSDIKDLEKKIKEKLKSEFPESEIRDLTILNWSIPDISLYNETKNIYFTGIKASRAYSSELEKQNAELESQLSSKMELLKDYGQILTDYPVLLQYFNLEKEKIDPLIFNWNNQSSSEIEP
ncbi:MAG: hypothetical protein B6241_02475 [Spirochaetaceae bacterium 4572_59]|nr:MAG: hypothetical protein B6241_02475 [Spirochaetaceae bacterium 4572_59]